MNSVLHLVGLSRKAGRLAVGEEPVGEAARSREAKLILTASDAAENTLRRAERFAESAGAPCLAAPFTKAELGGAVGRSSCALLAFTDVGLASAAAEKLAWEDAERYGPAAETLKEQTRRALERQKEQRAHEKNLQKKNKKPWAMQAPKKKDAAPSKSGERRDAGSAERARPAKPFAPKGKLTIKKRP